MGRRVFFSFHHQHDSWRVGQVRNSWLTKGDTNQFLDAAEWESVKEKGDAAVKRWIDAQLHGTSVTAVLVGTHTAERRYVRYEIEKSIARGNGLLAIYIHGLKDRNGRSSKKGRNPLEDFSIPNGNPFTNWLISSYRASSIYSAYYWYDDNGRDNLNEWIEEAARNAGR